MKLWRWLLRFVLLDVVLVVIAIAVFNLGVFQSSIEQWARTKSGAKVQLGKVSVLAKWPLTFAVQASSVTGPGLTLEWQELRLELRKAWPPYTLRLIWRAPQLKIPAIPLAEVRIEEPEEPPASGASATTSSSASAAIVWQVQIEQGEVVAQDFQLHDLSWRWLPAAPFQATARLQIPGLPLALPLRLESDDLHLSAQGIAPSTLKVWLWGWQGELHGQSSLKTGEHQWRFSLQAPDLAKLQPVPFAPTLSDWQGALTAQANFSKTSGRGWKVDGEWQALKVSGVWQWRDERWQIHGPLNLDSQCRFSYSEGQARVSELRATLDLSAAQIFARDLLNKAAGVPLRGTIAANGEGGVLHVDELQLRLWRLVAQLKGAVETASPYQSHLEFTVPKVSLEHAEEIFLPLGEMHQGQLAAHGLWRGPLAQVEQGEWNMQSLHLSADGVANYTLPGRLQARGPLKIEVEGAMSGQGRQLHEARGHGQFEATKAALVMGPLRKAENQELQLTFEAQSHEGQVRLSQLRLRSWLADLQASATLKSLQPLSGELKLQSDNLSLSELRRALPEVHDVLPSGSAHLNWLISGEGAEAKPWADWPLKISGSTELKIEELDMNAAPAAQAAPAKPSGAAPIAVAEQHGDRLWRNMDMNVDATLDHWQRDPWQADGLHIHGRITQAHFAGEAQVQKVLAGHLNLTDLSFPLTSANPALQGRAELRDISAEELVNSVNPENREWAKGKLNADLEFTTRAPEAPDFLAFLRLRGGVNASALQLPSLRFGKMVNQLVKQLPFIKMQPAKEDPFVGTAQLQMEVQNRTLKVESLEMKDDNGSELRATGKVNLATFDGDLLGNYFWANPPIRGCLLTGNADAKGRMVIPAAIRGDLKHPSLESLADIVRRLAGRTLQCLLKPGG
jgi:hypothetical protein